jgi:transcriptional regulator with XRE-family HTH domain
MWQRQQDYLRIGQQLQAIRMDASLTQIELAKKLRKPQSFVSSYERGQRRLDVLEFAAVVSAMGAEPETVFALISKSRKPSAKRKK